MRTVTEDRLGWRSPCRDSASWESAVAIQTCEPEVASGEERGNVGRWIPWRSDFAQMAAVCLSLWGRLPWGLDAHVAFVKMSTTESGLLGDSAIRCLQGGRGLYSVLLLKASGPAFADR